MSHAVALRASTLGMRQLMVTCNIHDSKLILICPDVEVKASNAAADPFGVTANGPGGNVALMRRMLCTDGL